MSKAFLVKSATMKKAAHWLKSPFFYKIDSIIYKLKIVNFVKFYILKFLQISAKSVFFRPALFLFHKSQPYLIAPTREGLSYVISSSDLCIGRLTFEDQFSYESEMIDLAIQSLNQRNIDQILDIGSNIGSVCIYSIKKKYAKKALAFEPDEFNFNLLNINIALNGFQELIEAKNVALCDKDNIKLQFAKSPDNFGDHRVSNLSQNLFFDCDGREIVSVEAATLESFGSQILESSTFIVADAQGSEGHILKGYPSLQNSHIPLLIEFYPEGLRNSDGFEFFVSALLSSGNTKLIDMSQPDLAHCLSRENLVQIANCLGSKRPETDLLVF